MESEINAGGNLAGPKSALSRRALYSALLILAALLLFFIPEIPSQAQVNLTDRDAVLAAVDIDLLSKIDYTPQRISDFEILTNNGEIKYTFVLKYNRTRDDGFNYIFLPPGTDIRTAKQLSQSIPSIQAINTLDKKTGKAIGFINTKGGRGANFPIKPLTIYEIFVIQNANWTISLTR